MLFYIQPSLSGANSTFTERTTSVYSDIATSIATSKTTEPAAGVGVQEQDITIDSDTKREHHHCSCFRRVVKMKKVQERRKAEAMAKGLANSSN